jgi:hypothetical protein
MTTGEDGEKCTEAFFLLSFPSIGGNRRACAGLGAEEVPLAL